MEQAYHKECGGEVIVRINHSTEKVYEVHMHNTLVRKPVLGLGEPEFKVLFETEQVLSDEEVSNYVCNKCGNILLEQDLRVEHRNLILRKGGKDDRVEQEEE